jgi:cob(I)alamin adenosyltransferase
LVSRIGQIKSETNDEVLQQSVEQVQSKLIQFIAHLSDKKNLIYFFERSDLEALEKSTNYYKVSLIQQHSLVGEHKAHLTAAFEKVIAIAKTVETYVVEVDKTSTLEANAKEYIRRLSDYLYSVATYVEFVESVQSAVVKAVRQQLSAKPASDIVGIDLKTAKVLIAEIEKKSIEMGLNSVIAVANASAHPVAIHCMDDSFIASFDIAMNKAYTSVALKMSTIELKALSQPNGSLYGIQHTNNGKIVIFGGGVPLIVEGKIVGGLGVSGGTEQQDTELAQYGQNLFKEVITWQ